MKLGLVSDTHVPNALKRLPRVLLDALERAGVERILHAGDLTSAGVITSLEQVAPTVAVAGNMDPPEVRSTVLQRVVVDADGWKIGLQHGHQRQALQSRYIGLGYDQPEMQLFYHAMTTQLPDAQIIVFGHFHVPVVRQWQNVLFINPGAVAPSYGRSTFAIVELAAAGDSELPAEPQVQMDRQRRTGSGTTSLPGVRVRIVELTRIR